ncbi:MAG TPA: AAA family ATPase, partial [Halothiobacillus sp.]|nr:AAA family ATPase [Halothiobacillus sp.]
MNSFQLPLDFSTEEPVAPSGLPIPLPALMDQWVASGWLRRVDRAVARWLMAQALRADPSVILALVLASHQAGQGHVCLDLVACLGDPDAVLKMPPRDDFSIRGMRLPPRPSSVLRGWTLNDWTAVLAAESHLVEVINGRSAVGPVADQGTETPDVPPFVLDGTRLYLRRYWQQEQAIAVRILSRLAGARPSQDAGAIRETFDRLFGPTVTNDEADWQKIACSLAVRHPFSIITGGPGTGKTTTVVKFLMLSQILAIRAGLPAPRIRLCAPTGKAAARLKQSILGQIAALLTQFDSAYPTLAEALPQTVDTLHRLIGVRPNQARPTHHEANWLAADIVVIDEASMIGLELMARTLAALAPDTQLVLLGDRDQLASVEPGAVLGALCAQNGVQVRYDAETCAWIRQTTGFALEPTTEPGSRLDQATVTLRHSHRFGPDSSIGDLAQSVNKGDAAAARRLLQADPPHESLRLLLDDPRSSRLAQLVVEVLAPWLR